MRQYKSLCDNKAYCSVLITYAKIILEMGDEMTALEAANEIVRKIVENIKDSRQQLFFVIEDLKKDYEMQVLEFHQISKQIDEGYKTYTKEIEKEKKLRRKRDDLEIKLKETLKIIETTEIMAQQINVAMKYLKKDLSNSMGEDQVRILDISQRLDILKAQEAERARIGREIHDGPAQHMANTLMMVDFCKNVINKDMKAGMEELEALKQNVKVALKEVRRILFDLKPIELEELGLNQAIEELIENITVDTQLQVVKNFNEIKEEIEPMIQVVIYRMIQEIFNNIRKHSKATRVSIQIDSAVDTLVIIVSDNGIGFDVKKVLYQMDTERRSYGLVGIQERVRQVGGSIEIRSDSDEGTVYYIKIPIK